MGKNSAIAWTDHTFNAWIGCAKVSEGCRNCYAERDAKRHQFVTEWGKDYHLTSDINWKKPILWAKDAVRRGVRERVFSLSMGDIFDLKVPSEWRTRLFNLIDETGKTGGLEWLLLTKRIENAEALLPLDWLVNPPTYIRLGISTENQEMFNLRFNYLIRCWAGKNFVSVEPMLGEVNIQTYHDSELQLNQLIDWVICGSESLQFKKPGRPCDDDWVRKLRDQCIEENIPFFLKQLENHDHNLEILPYLDGVKWVKFPNDKS